MIAFLDKFLKTFLVLLCRVDDCSGDMASFLALCAARAKFSHRRNRAVFS